MSLQGREGLGLGFLSSWVPGLLAFLAGPVVVAVVTFFADPSILGPAHWMGPLSHQGTLHDAALGHGLLVALLYSGLVLPADLLAGPLLALVLNARKWGVGRVRTVFLLPLLVSATGGASLTVALLWLAIFNPRLGLLKVLLGLSHLPPQTWVYSDRAVLPLLALLSLWTVGRSMLVYLAGLQGLPAEVLWSAHVDRASPWRRFWRVTLPLISTAWLFNLLLDLVQGVQIFSQAYVVSHVNPGQASLSYLVYLLQSSLTPHRTGDATPLGWIVFGVLVVLSALIFRSARRWVRSRGAPS